VRNGSGARRRGALAPTAFALQVVASLERANYVYAQAFEEMPRPDKRRQRVKVQAAAKVLVQVVQIRS
jgi:hypothetical protein